MRFDPTIAMSEQGLKIGSMHFTVKTRFGTPSSSSRGHVSRFSFELVLQLASAPFRSVSGPFRLRLAPFCFGSVLGPFRGVGWGQDEVGEGGFCERKEYH